VSAGRFARAVFARRIPAAVVRRALSLSLSLLLVACAPPPRMYEVLDVTPRDAARTDAPDARVLTCNGVPCIDDDPCTIEECVDRVRCTHTVAPTLCRCAPGCVDRAQGAADDAGPWSIDASSEAGSPIVVTDGGSLTVALELEDEDYLWVPNTNESTLSKWDARTRTELARYRVGIAAGECAGRCCWVNNCNMPSRTVVDGRGDAYVASRGFMMQGTVSKIAARRRDCVDRNGNGMIDTSTGPANVLPFNEDECVLWTANVGPLGAVLRSLAIDRGSEDNPNGTPWVGACESITGLNNAGLFQLDPRTGAVLRAVDFDRCAYGAVVTPDGTLWQHSHSRGLTPVNPYSGIVGTFVPLPTTFARGGCVTSYGVTADMQGRLWLSGSACADVLGYDPRSRAWTRVELRSRGATAAGLGITVDSTGRVWVPAAGSPPRVFSWDAEAFVRGSTIAARDVSVIELTSAGAGWTPSAIGVDRGGALWVASYTLPSPLVRVDLGTSAVERIDGPNRVYTYTDFTGGVRRLLLGSATHNEVIDTQCVAPQYAELRWRAETPPGTSLSFSMRVANSESALATAPVVAVATVPSDVAPADLTARLRAEGIENPGRFARISIAFTPSSAPVGRPTLDALELSWRCPMGPG
jgi:streptogramin lyase